MFWRSRRVHRQWQLHYIYLYHGREIREVARFFSQAQIRGPHGFQRDLLHA
jgi:hypothetical protein